MTPPGFVLPDMLPATAEIFLLGMACIVLVVDVYLPERFRRFTYQLSQASLAGAALLVLATFPDTRATTFEGAFVADPMAAVLKVFILVVSGFGLFYSRVHLEARRLMRGEYFVLGLFAVLGMLVLVSAGSFLTLYLGLELLSLSLYAMVALDRESRLASEAAMKYFVLGALASGMLLYGISMIYGSTGSLGFSAVAESVGAAATSVAGSGVGGEAGAGAGGEAMAESGVAVEGGTAVGNGAAVGSGAGAAATSGSGMRLTLVLGLVFVVVGVAFKLGAVPFHMWVPDVYEGAATPVTLFIGTAPKIAAFGMLMRALVEGLGALQADWSQMLVVLAVLSMGAGNVIALAQTNIKRMLAYSTIAHVGFIFVGVVSGTAAGYAASMFYVLTYALMALGGFAMVIWLGSAGEEADRLEDFRGLNERNPWFAFMMLILMLSMAGMPPFVGFWAKWSVLREVVASGMTWLAVVAVLFSVVGLFYYLRVVRLMYFDSPEEKAPVSSLADMRVVVSVNALAILALGIYPGALLRLCAGVIGP